MIFINPYGGLGNRMRVIKSAVYLARETKQKLKVIWINGGACPCNFEDLFLGLTDVDYEVGNYVYNSVSLHDLLRNHKIFSFCKEAVKRVQLTSQLWLIRIRSQFFFHGSIQFSKNELEKCKQARCIYIYTESDFYGGDDYDMFAFREDLVMRAQNIIGIDRADVFGIHIRMGDNEEAIINSPLQLFVDKIDEEIRVGRKFFFLATDEEKIKVELSNKYKQACIVCKDPWCDRYSISGQQQALVELLCLSMTKVIYGSYYTSFSEVAAKVGRIEKITLM